MTTKPTAPPPPPNYPPTVGQLAQSWWSYQNTSAAMWTPERIAAAEAGQSHLTTAISELTRTITETPEQRRARLRQEDDYERRLQGETPQQQATRHRREDRQRQRAASRLWKVGQGEKARRFRRWCTFTAISATAGYAIGLVGLFTNQSYYWLNAAVLFPALYVLDRHLRGGWVKAERLSDLRGPHAISAVLLTRVPVASVLASLLKLDGLLAAATHTLHNL